MAPPFSAARFAAILAAARQAWPGVTVPDARFAAYLAARLPPGVTADADAADAAVAGFDTTALYLACACLDGDAAAIGAFERTFLARIGPAVAQVGSAPDFVDEVQQRLRERLLVGARPRIGDYNGKGPLAGWVRVAAIRMALNTVRESRRNAQIRPEPAVARDPEVDLIHRQYQREVETAFRTAFGALDEESRRLLRQHYLDNVTIEKIAQQLGVERSTASRRLLRVRQALLDQVQRELERLIPDITQTSRDSLLGAIGSQLQLSLHSVLAP